MAGGLLLIALAAVAVVVLLLVSAKASLNADANGLANVGMPLGGGTIESVEVTTGPNSRRVPVELRGNQIWPKTLIPAGQRVDIDAVVRRPGWIAWLAGKTQHLKLELMTPTTKLRAHYLTLAPRSPIRLSFKVAVREISYGRLPNAMHRRVLANPRTAINLTPTAAAGSLWVAAAPRRWETSKPAVVSWFPAGAAAAAVASPAPGTRVTPSTPITLTFNKTVRQALGSSRPPVNPITPGSWHSLNPHAIIFRPEGFGYGLGAHVTIGLPSGVRLVGANGTPAWSVAPGSTMRLQQLLANLGYLPLRFQGHPVAHTPQAQEAAAIKPPSGHFAWRYPNVPPALQGMWSPGSSGVMTEGALMAFENDHGLTADGIAGATVWKALITAADSGKSSPFGYSFVQVSLSGQQLNLWHSGRTIVTTPVNTGISSRPTDPGTFPVYSHLRVTTMSGTNPDGSHYDDPGIQYVSYFNGGDALHAFTRAQYGFPQSLGCVEMMLGPAGQVWPYTPIGTLVHVA